MGNTEAAHTPWTARLPRPGPQDSPVGSLRQVTRPLPWKLQNFFLNSTYSDVKNTFKHGKIVITHKYTQVYAPMISGIYLLVIRCAWTFSPPANCWRWQVSSLISPTLRKKAFATGEGHKATVHGREVNGSHWWPQPALGHPP